MDKFLSTKYFIPVITEEWKETLDYLHKEAERLQRKNISSIVIMSVSGSEKNKYHLFREEDFYDNFRIQRKGHISLRQMFACYSRLLAKSILIQEYKGDPI